MDDQPKLLVEGGPVHRRVNFILAALIGVVIGGGAGLTVAYSKIVRQQHRNCDNITRLAGIERRLVNRTEAQTRLVLAKGATFGLRKADIQALVEAAKASEATFLMELQELARSNC